MKIVTFGEIIRRWYSDFLRLRQCNSFDVTYAGAEASAAVSANFSGDVTYVSAPPKHALADAD